MIVKCISLNLWSGGKLFPEIIDFLRAEDADVVLLQEVQAALGTGLPHRFNSLNYLSEQLEYQFQEFAKAMTLALPEGKVASGNAILSKYPILSTSLDWLYGSTLPEYQDIPEHWPLEPRILQGAVLQTEVGELGVYNMHGVWDLDGENPSPQRKSMVERILAAAQNKTRLILAGDTNAATANPVLADLNNVFINVFGSELRSTFNMRRKDNPGYATAAVDHMWVSQDVTVKSRHCPDIDISDHLPLIAEFEIK